MCDAYAYEPGPCDGCWHRNRCAEQLLVCSAFAAFVSGKPQRKWQGLPRVDASHEKYLQIGLGGDDQPVTKERVRVPGGRVNAVPSGPGDNAPPLSKILHRLRATDDRLRTFLE